MGKRLSTLESSNGFSSYKGETSGLRMTKDGFGKITYYRGKVRSYTGNWKNNKYHGIGVLVKIDGSVYEGNFDEGKAVGTGKWTLASGTVIEGEFSDDRPHGFAIERVWNGQWYEG